MAVQTAPTRAGGLTPPPARVALWREWLAAAPDTAAAVHAFYATSTALAADLDAWHTEPIRQQWTDTIVRIAQETGAARIVDIGCGAGHDLAALHVANPQYLLWGVEPNEHCRLAAAGNGTVQVYAAAEDAPLETADLLLCLDVLEHLPDPETFLTAFATRARLGAVLIETCATDDIANPLHLPANRGWTPGRALERAGWVQLDRDARFGVWQRAYAEGPLRASALVCAYRSVGIGTLTALLNLVGAEGTTTDDSHVQRVARPAGHGWRLTLKHADALISRGRSIVLSDWWRNTADDVCLFVDDDILFSVEDADRLVARCRAGYDVICAAYPIGDGSHLAVRGLDGDHTLAFGPGEPPHEIAYAATGFLAIHRRVVDALVPTLPLCHADQRWAFWPFFLPLVYPLGACDGYLSEDWAMSQRARDAGFRVWLDPSICIGHLKPVEINVRNMAAYAPLIQEATHARR